MQRQRASMGFVRDRRSSLDGPLGRSPGYRRAMRSWLFVTALAACGHAPTPAAIHGDGVPTAITFGRLGPRVGDTQTMVRDADSESRESVDGGAEVVTTHHAHLEIATTIRAVDGDRPVAATIAVRAADVSGTGVVAASDPTVGKIYEVEVRAVPVVAAAADDDVVIDDAEPAETLQIVSVATDAERAALQVPAIEDYLLRNLRPDALAVDDLAVVGGTGLTALRLADVHDGVAHLISTETRRTMFGTSKTSITYELEVATGRILGSTFTVATTWGAVRGADSAHNVDGSSTRTVRQRFTYR